MSAGGTEREGRPREPDLCKNLRMSPWGATTRLINLDDDDDDDDRTRSHRDDTDWKREGFTTYETAFMNPGERGLSG